MVANGKTNTCDNRYLISSHSLRSEPLLPHMTFRRSHLPHDPPNWIDPTQEAFFITINCLPRGVNQLAHDSIWTSFIETIEFREQKGDWK